MKTVDKGFWNQQKIDLVKEFSLIFVLSAKNLAQWEEIDCLNNFGDIIFAKDHKE
jgi:hypothetical protein